MINLIKNQTVEGINQAEIYAVKVLGVETLYFNPAKALEYISNYLQSSCVKEIVKTCMMRDELRVSCMYINGNIEVISMTKKFVRI